MTRYDTLRQALSGADILSFTPLVWRSVPQFLGSSAESEWWHDPKEAQTLLNDAGAVCGADALMVPLVHSDALIEAEEQTKEDPRLLEHVTDLPAIASGLALIGRMQAARHYGVVALVPTLEEFGQALPWEEPEAAEDGLKDIARDALDSGAVALAVTSPRREQLIQTVTKLAPISDYFGSHILAVHREDPWIHQEPCHIGVLTETGQWPSLRRGVVATHEDVTSKWTPHEMRRILESYPQ